MGPSFHSRNLLDPGPLEQLDRGLTQGLDPVGTNDVALIRQGESAHSFQVLSQGWQCSSTLLMPRDTVKGIK